MCRPRALTAVRDIASSQAHCAQLHRATTPFAAYTTPGTLLSLSAATQYFISAHSAPSLQSLHSLAIAETAPLCVPRRPPWSLLSEHS